MDQYFSCKRIKTFVYISFLSCVIFTFSYGLAAAQEIETVKVFASGGDGRIQTPLSQDWDWQHDINEGANVYDEDRGIYALSRTAVANDYNIVRGFLVFDTSEIPEDVEITEVSLNAYVYATHNDDNDDFAYVGVYEGLQQNPSGLVASDITKCGNAVDDPTVGSDKIDIDSVSENSFLSIPLNQVGQEWVNLNGYTKLCIREGHDAEDQPVRMGNYVYSGIRFFSSEEPGTEKDPYLEVKYIVNPEPENPYPLYTQGTSSYPSLAETSSWANDWYAGGESYWCGSTIAECGCAITSLTMLGRYTGATEDVLGGDVNPGNMNTYLQSSVIDGYTDDATVKWLAGIAYMSELTPSGLVSRLSEPVFTPKGTSSAVVMEHVDEALAAGKGVLGFKNGHFVWVTEKTAAGYLVNDPWWYNTKTADDVASSTDLIRDYNNAFDSARIFTISDTPVALPERGIEGVVTGTAEILYTNAVGEQAGYKEGSLVYEVDGASYGDVATIALNGSTPEAAGGHLLVPDTTDTFTVEVIGTGVGTYEFEVLVLNGSGDLETYTFAGQTLPGISTMFEFNLATGEVTEQPITLEDFQEIIEVLLGGATDQQRAFFLKRAEKLFNDMEEKTVSQALQQASVFRTLLEAKKINVPVFFSMIDAITMQLQSTE